MKTGKVQQVKRVAAPRKQNMGKTSAGAKRNTTNKVPGQHSSLQVAVQCISCKAQCSATKETPSPFKIAQVETQYIPPKIKLQLFPLDERVRTCLEQDGYVPYLELILRPKKRISSVLNHLRNKWGSSSVAIGEPVLFPFNVSLEHLAASQHWTLHHRGVTAGDVHKAVGSPKTFRLRYGWFTLQPSKYCLPPPSTSFKEREISEKVQSWLQETTCNTTTNPQVTASVHRSMDASEPANATPVDQVASAEILNNEEPRTENGFQPMSSLWSDGLSNISMGAIFSEVSMEDLLGLSDPISNRGRDELLPYQPIPDPLDAHISNLSKKTEVQKNVFHGSSSIFDAEAACDTFVYRKSAMSTKHQLQIDGSSLAATSNHDVGTKLYDITEATEDGLPNDITDQEIETGTTFHAGIFNDDRSTGLSGIKWSDDSIPPFGLGYTT